MSRFRLAHTYRLQGQYPEAIETLRQIQKVDSGDISVLYDMGVVYDAMGDPAKARECFKRYRDQLETRWKKTSWEPETQLALATALARLGETGRARHLLHDAMTRAPQLHLDAAFVLSLLGEKEQAVSEMKLAIQDGFTNYIWLKVNPDLLPLHHDQGYEQLLSELIKT